MSEQLSYPIGRFTRPEKLSAQEYMVACDRLTAQPARLRAAVTGLTDDQLNTPYRPGGWTVKQLTHHVADSHLNMYIRVKVALTESHPTIKPYDQDAWTTLPDVAAVPAATSLTLFDAVQERAMAVLRTLTEADRARTLNHPENGTMSIDQVVALYAWHGDHHAAHVENLRTRMGW